MDKKLSTIVIDKVDPMLNSFFFKFFILPRDLIFNPECSPLAADSFSVNWIQIQKSIISNLEELK